ncbi:1-acyl-sn-glycerol-3-phosphate acyltransferase [Aeoliella sp. ICT_H6.2]|uniref:1-acyl-sn-glycerol-3-phosphate acyltransferase n=1 Tax=Aeoliella straminimaris TaxID=2954799 RepID=A0A9X2FCL2_9BACT|nr:1-acyl-sn-glycerol-3-phosphate acyltransferase [Aeoliella straminimaris]MCO6045562.1 1-acyl-sn-glycerol-3-phosphate acyltransferase [Aeoliella straminimaris]
MQNIIFEERYEFVPPVESDWWVFFLRFLLKGYLRKQYNIHTYECRNVERITKSVEEGYGVLIAPNHARIADPIVMGLLSGETQYNVATMAGWHLFKEGWYQKFILRRLGAFSVYREGTDRQSVNYAIDTLVAGRRALVIFPEGAVSRHCDVLMDLMEGPGFIARQASKRREKEGKKPVVIHPVAVRYSFDGDPYKTVAPDLARLERSFSWEPQTHLTTAKRMKKLGEAMLAIKEVEYLGGVRQGDPYERVERLAMDLITELEDKYGIKDRSPGVVSRVKNIRSAILPAMIEGTVSEAERAARWRDLGKCYYAQQMAHYPRNYIVNGPNLPERVLETVQRLEEDFTDTAPNHGPLHATIDVGEPILVESKRDRSAKKDPAMVEVGEQLQKMIDALVAERTPVTEKPPAQPQTPPADEAATVDNHKQPAAR